MAPTNRILVFREVIPANSMKEVAELESQMLCQRGKMITRQTNDIRGHVATEKFEIPNYCCMVEA